MLSLPVLAVALAHCVPPSDIPVQELSVAGVSSIAVRSSLPPRIDALVVAVPFGVDFQLQGPPSTEEPAPRADNPVRRFGPRVMLINSGASGEVLLHIIGKERQGHGTVGVLLAPLTTWHDRPLCLESLRLTAAADTHYARAEGVPQQGPSPGVDVPAEYRAAAGGYEAAASALSASTHEPLFAKLLLAAAAVRYQDSSDWQQAADDAMRAREAFSALGDSYWVARSGAILAGAGMELALADRARPGGSAEAAAQRLADVRREFMALARFYQARGERFDAAMALNSAGLADYDAGAFTRGMSTYRAALSLFVSLGESPREAQVLQNIALIEYELGRYPEARRDYAKAREVLPPDPNSEELPDILNNLALAEYASGNLDQALEHYGEALTMLEHLQVPVQVARSLHGLGIVYYAAGDREQALAYFTRALKLRSAEKDARGRTATLRAMAAVLSDLGRKAEAIDLRRQALALAVAPAVRVRIDTQLAADFEALGQPLQAMATAGDALKDSQRAPRAYRALALATRAKIEFDQRAAGSAQRDVERALALLKGSTAATDEFNVQVLAARIAQARGDTYAASHLIDQALALAEELRLESANPELRAGIWQGLKPAFDLKLDLTTGDSTTLAVAESYRARSLADYWRGGDGTSPERLRTVYGEIAARRSQLEIRLDRSGENDPRTRALEADIAKLRREADTLHRTAPTRLEASPELARVVEMIPPDVAVVEYWLGTSRARVWVITRHRVAMAMLSETLVVERTAQALQQSLRSYSNEDRGPQIATLSQQIIPREALRYPKLIIIPDGALHYVPFAILTTTGERGSRPLLEDHVILTAPSLGAALWERAGPISSKRVLIVSDPAYGASYEALPGTAVEATAIASDFDPREVDRLSGIEASRASLLGRDLSGYRVIHFAAHARTDSEAPLLSALILSTRDAHGARVPGEVFAGELAARKLNAQLVVLSACDTSLGRDVLGEGLLGLRYATHAAGASSVVASLWPASERATTELMKSFYAHYETRREPPALALTQAMREVRARFPDPALWGAFEASAAGAEAMFADRPPH